jgi:hypothetical protein
MNNIVVKYREGENDKPDWWELHQPVTEILSNGIEITISAGYVTDFASVPPILWSLIPPIGKYNRGALVHDYLYDLQFQQAELGEYEARKFADLEFLRICNRSNPKGKIRHKIMFYMVRIFGLSAWRRTKQ